MPARSSMEKCGATIRALSRESSIRRQSVGLIEPVEGKLVIADVPGSGGLLVLSMLARREARLGLVPGIPGPAH